MALVPEELLVVLRDTFRDKFDLSELTDFAQDLGINIADLPGVSRSDKARELSQYLARHGQLWKLSEVGPKYRGDIDWTGILRQYGFGGTAIPAVFKYELINILNRNFNLAELASLMQRLEIGTREITGSTRLARAESLIQYFWDHKLLVDLVIVGPEYRPDIDWLRILRQHQYDFADSVMPIELSIELEAIIVVRFNLTELEDLMMELSIDYENLVGSTKQTKAKNLVAYIWEHKLLAPLAYAGSRLRPDINWIELLKDYAFDKYSIPLPLWIDLVRVFYLRFSLEELISAMYELGIDHENIEGTTHASKAKQFSEYLWNHQLLSALLETKFVLAPQLDWTSIIGPYAYMLMIAAK